MYKIVDYIKYYKDLDTRELKWNIMDNLICSILSYVPSNSFNGYSDLKGLKDSCKGNSNPNSYMDVKSLEILDLIIDSKRYGKMLAYNFVNIRDNNTQFGAVKLVINNIIIISFKGTDTSLIGWVENFRLAYKYPTYTHNLAIEYLNNNISLLDNNIYVVGHSKGGNLAFVSAMELPNRKFNKIIEIDNFDGPGLRKKEFETDKYNKVLKKLVNIIPQDSMVGVLLNNKNYKVINSEAFAWKQHYPVNFSVFGTFFIEDVQSKTSQMLHTVTTDNLNNVSYEELENSLETLFKNMDIEFKDEFSISKEEILKFYRGVQKLDDNVSKNLADIIKIILSFKKDEK